MATSPFRLPASLVESLRKLSEQMSVTMADWVKDRIKAEDAELNTRVQPKHDHPSLIRDLWAHGRSTPEGRQAQKEKILQGLRDHLYDLNETGIDNLTSLHWAARGQVDLELAGAILEKAQDVSPRDAYGNTPLVLAITEQSAKLEKNLPIIQVLLTRSRDEDLLLKPSIMGGNECIYDYAVARGMRGTASLIRERFQRFNLEASLSTQSGTLNDMAERISRVMYYQGRKWENIATELSNRGFDRSHVWYHLNRMGAWHKFLDEMKANGSDDAACVKSLRNAAATWVDIASAYLGNGYPSDEIVSTLYPFVHGDGLDHAAISQVVAGAIALNKNDDLRPTRDVLKSLGENPREIVGGLPYAQDVKARILQRMGI